jgi:hypothetical protein
MGIPEENCRQLIFSAQLATRMEKHDRYHANNN